jgi:hypothetical protein
MNARHTAKRTATTPPWTSGAGARNAVREQSGPASHIDTRAKRPSGGLLTMLCNPTKESQILVTSEVRVLDEVSSQLH